MPEQEQSTLDRFEKKVREHERAKTLRDVADYCEERAKKCERWIATGTETEGGRSELQSAINSYRDVRDRFAATLKGQAHVDEEAERPPKLSTQCERGHHVLCEGNAGMRRRCCCDCHGKRSAGQVDEAPMTERESEQGFRDDAQVDEAGSSEPIPREYWREIPCGHPPDPVAMFGRDGEPVCHCGCILDQQDGIEVDEAPGPIVQCSKCGCGVAIPPQPTDPGRG